MKELTDVFNQVFKSDFGLEGESYAADAEFFMNAYQPSLGKVDELDDEGSIETPEELEKCIQATLKETAAEQDELELMILAQLQGLKQMK